MSEEFMYKWHKHENLHKDDIDMINYGFILFLLFNAKSPGFSPLLLEKFPDFMLDIINNF